MYVKRKKWKPSQCMCQIFMKYLAIKTTLDYHQCLRLKSANKPNEVYQIGHSCPTNVTKSKRINNYATTVETAYTSKSLRFRDIFRDISLRLCSHYIEYSSHNLERDIKVL